MHTSKYVTYKRNYIKKLTASILKVHEYDANALFI